MQIYSSHIHLLYQIQATLTLALESTLSLFVYRERGISHFSWKYISFHRRGEVS